MSSEPTLAPRAYGDAQDGAAQKGSVRAARERMQAAQMRAQLPDTSKIIGLPQRPNQLASQYSANRDDVSQPKTPTDLIDDERMPSPPPQWPLPDDASPTIPPRSPKRIRPPQPTIRPVSDDYPIQQLSPGSPSQLSPDYLQPPQFNFRIPNRGDDMYSPSSRPFSGASEASSLGSIPDFPVPEPPMPPVQLPRRVPSLGPPPSSRRGPSSYYTQMSYVSPIVEESETRSDTIRSRHGSFASSNVFPVNGDDFYQGDYPRSDDEETITSDRGTMSPASDHNDESGLVTESPTLVRQASLGRRSKPSLMTIKSVDGIGEKKSGNTKKVASGAVLGAAGAGGLFAARTMAQGSPLRSSILSNGTGLIDQSSSSSENSLTSPFRNTNPTSPSYTGAESPIFPFRPEARTNTLSERIGFKRPPRLDMDTVRDAEARGSLTSLPDLIRRATRLAANLDRGRTASRLGLDFWESGAPPEQNNVRISQNSLTDMLAAFPPPGQETPLRSGTPAGNVMMEWPSSGGGALRSGGADQGYSKEKPVKERRRCCGLPLWTFITLLIVLLFIVAAAVVIPVVLVVIPNQNKGTNAAQDNQGATSTSSAPAPTSVSGDSSGNCQNGGVAIQNTDQSTTCVCINGFTGSTCGTKDQTGCTTTSIMGTANNATVGSGIPRIVKSASGDFNVPLNATRILSLFSSLSLSCAAENALITFNGLTSRSIPADQSLDLGLSLPTRSLPTLHLSHSADQIQARQDAVPISSNTTAVDFARVGVLFALQQDGKLDTAATAQENIQDFLTNNRNGNSNAKTVDIGPFTLNLLALTIKFDNGTTIGATS